MIPASHRLANDKPLFAQNFSPEFLAQDSLLRILCAEFFARNFFAQNRRGTESKFLSKGS